MSEEFPNIGAVIERYLDEYDCITYRTLASTVKCNVNHAKCELKEYLQSHTEVKGLYLISGSKRGVLFSFCVVDEFDLEETKKKFDKIENIHIYSIHRPSTAITSMMTQASALDHNNFQEWNSDLLANSLGNIHLSGVLVLPPGQKVRQEVPPSLLGKQQSSLPLPRVQSAQKQHQSKQEVPKAAHSFFNKKDTSSLPSSSKPSNVSSRPPLGSKKTIEKPSATTAVKTSVSNPLVASEDELGSSQDESLQAKKEQITEDVDEDEWEEGGFNTGEKYVLDKEKLKKRDEIQSINSHFLDDESSEDEDVETKGNGQKKESKAKRKGKKRVSDLEELSDSDNFTEKKTKKSKKKQSVEADVPTPKIQIHGAMDDFFEDIVRKQGSDGNILKKKKTKLVEKVFADEKGYLVTEMVYEEISDDEQTPQSTLPKTVSNTSVKSDTDNHKESGNSKKKSSSKQTTATASKGQQKSMMSYFTKK